jgi:hypothetical protein
MTYNKKYQKACEAMYAKEKIFKQTKEYKAYDRARQKWDKMFHSCPHEETVEKSRYYDGSYLDKAQTHYWNECVLCGKVVKEWTEVHSYYG